MAATGTTKRGIDAIGSTADAAWDGTAADATVISLLKAIWIATEANA